MNPRIPLLVCLVLALSWPAAATAAEPTPGGGHERHASDVVDPLRVLAPCDPAGPTASDAALATQLNATLRAKMRGYMNAYRVSCARMVVRAVAARGLHPRAATIAITTTIVESSIDNIAEEIDHDSLGLFQQRASWGSRAQRLDPTWATNAFLNKMLEKFPNNGWMTAQIGVVCQTVQVSAYPERYQPQAGDGQIIADALWPIVKRTRFADLTGDGLAEIITIGGNGDVVAYRNRGNWDAGDVYSGPDSKLVAKGFTDPARTKFGDLTGDGRAEIITIGGNGDVVAYRNRGNWDAGDVYSGPDSKLVAKGFTLPDRTFFADLTGDRRDEIVAIGGNGDVVAYRNRGNWDAGDVYSGPDSKLVAKGFTDPPRTAFADLTGDDRDEIVALYGNGDVVAYRNRGNWDAGDLYNGSDNRLVAKGFTDANRTRFGDLTGDRRDEIITIGGNGDVVAYRNRGNWDAGDVYAGSDSKLVAKGFGV